MSQEQCEAISNTPYWGRYTFAAGVLVFVIGQVSALLSVIFISHQLSTEAFGQLSTGLAIQGYVVIVGTLGLRTIVVRDLARHPDQVGKVWGTLWLLTAPLGVGVAIIGHVIAGLVFDRELVEVWMSIWLAVGAWFSMMSVAPILDGLNRQRIGIATTMFAEIMFLLSLVSGLLPGELIWIAIGFAVKWILASLLQVIALWRIALVRLQVCRSMIRSWWRPATWLLATTLISQLPLTLSVVLQRSLQDANAAAVTGFAVQFAMGILLFAGLAFRFVQPSLRTADDFRSGRTRSPLQKMGVALIVVWLLGISASWILERYWLPAEFHQTWPTFLLLLTAALFGGGAYLLWAMLNALDMEASILIAYFVGTVLFLCGSFILIPPFGHVGGAWATLIATFSTFFVMVLEVQRGLRRPRPQHGPG